MKLKMIGKIAINLILALSVLLLSTGCYDPNADSGEVKVDNGPFIVLVENGSILTEPDSNDRYSKKSLCTVQADEPEEGQIFIAWKLWDTVVSTEATYTFEVTRNVSLIAEFGTDPNEAINGSPNYTGEYYFYDNFLGTTLNDEYWSCVDEGTGFGNNEKQYYTPDNITVDNGILRITVEKEDRRDENAERDCSYTSGKLWTRNKFAHTYGKVEARIRLFSDCSTEFGSADMQGLWPAFWMMPQDGVYGGWPTSGEIDIMEARGRKPMQVGSTVHRRAVSGNTWVSTSDYVFPNEGTIYDWHTYAVEWGMNDITGKVEIRYYVDDALYTTITSWPAKDRKGALMEHPKPFDQDFYVILNLAVGGNFDGGREPNDSIFAEESPAVTMEVDYVLWTDILPRTEA